ncbi:MAG TPA: PEP/pyruvate-binding domain-containing protein, partial [archaeon]|nr:PEP/pyruvate-binding domain-containing protein [archaeon]
MAAIDGKLVLWFEEIGKGDTAIVGGKCASLGEMNNKVNVPVLPGFAITADAYRHFIEHAGLKEFVRETLHGLDTHNMRDLARRGKLIRRR